MIRYMLLPRPVKETLRQVLLSLKHQWYPKPSIVHPMLMSDTAHLRRRIKLKLVSSKGTQFLCQRIPLDRAAPMSHQLTGRVGTVTSLVIGQISVPILPSRMLKETSVRGVFTTLLWRKFLLVKWSPLVSSLLMITLQLCSLIRVLRIPL